ncbi:MAG: DJ-1/PfpI family protein [Symploca sp. SIO2C1]|nr:DJ-1/PfpI family protein [Symploca sp. SIO2C1]
MKQQNSPFIIGIPIYQGVDLLDIAAPYEIFNWMSGKLKEHQVKVYLIGEINEPIITGNGLQLQPHKTFNEVLQLDVIWVPGGEPSELKNKMQDETFLNFLRTRSETAKYVTSVCEGALLLASAGLLDGYSATTHWAFIPCLKQFPQINVVDGYPRFFVDDSKGTQRGIRVTGGGISSGLDEALELVKLIAGEEVAEEVQLSTQYFPDPPIKADLEKRVDELKQQGDYCCPIWPELCEPSP